MLSCVREEEEEEANRFAKRGLGRQFEIRGRRLRHTIGNRLYF
jgi:hypothetical protein